MKIELCSRHILALGFLAVALTTIVREGSAQNNDPKTSPEAVINELESSAKAAPPKEFSEQDVNLRKLDRIMERWSLSEKQLVEMQALVIQRGGSRLSWPYVLAEGRLNLLWQKQGFPTGSFATAEEKYLQIATNKNLPEQMRAGYANRIDILISNAWNSKQEIPKNFRQEFIRAMVPVIGSGKDRDFVQQAIEKTILWGGDVPEATEAVVRACKSADSEKKKWCIWRLGFGVTRHGVLRSPRAKELVDEIKGVLREGDARQDPDIVEKAIFSAHSIARQPLTPQDREEVISLLAALIKTGKTAKVRFRAHDALTGDVTTDGLARKGSDEEKKKIRQLLDGYDPKPDRDEFLGGKARKTK